MRRYVTIFFLLLLTTFSHLSAFDTRFYLSADLLYMQPSIDQPEFVIDSISTVLPDGERAHNAQGYHFGYRAEGGFRLCDSLTELGIRWTYFPSFSENREVTGADLFPVLNFPEPTLDDENGTATISTRFSVRFLNGFLRQKIVDSRCYSFSLLGGIQYGYLKLREKVEYPDNGNSTVRNIDSFSRTQGLGPAIGVESHYHFLGCLQFVADITSGWLIADIDKNYRETRASTSATLVNVTDDKYWRLIPTIDLRMGLNYLRSIFCLQLDLGVGYEVIVAWKAIENIYFVDSNNRGSSFNKERTLSMQGPYAHLGISF